MSTTLKTASLYYKDGGSDKVYNVSIQLIPSGGAALYNVAFAYGRRGSALNTGNKNSSPLALIQAEKMFDKLVKEKTAKGYKHTPISGSVASTPPIPTSGSSLIGIYGENISPQLLNPVPEEMLRSYIINPSAWAQTKHDGQRMTIKKRKSIIWAMNRKGEPQELPEEFAKLKELDFDFAIDGENMGAYYVLFDVLEFEGYNLYNETFRERCTYLHKFEGVNNILIDYPATSQMEKESLFTTLMDKLAEGIVFKFADSKYIAGRPASLGSQLKYKFYSTASFIVTGQNEQRSVSLGLYKNTRSITKFIAPAGNVTIPVNHEVPAVDSVVEVRYLYAFKESGSIYQPVYLGERSDIDPVECTQDQLKYKPDDTSL